MAIVVMVLVMMVFLEVTEKSKEMGVSGSGWGELEPVVESQGELKLERGVMVEIEVVGSVVELEVEVVEIEVKAMVVMKVGEI